MIRSKTGDRYRICSAQRLTSLPHGDYKQPVPISPVNKRSAEEILRASLFKQYRDAYLRASIAALISATQVALSMQTFVVNVNVSTMVSMLASSSAWDDGTA